MEQQRERFVSGAVERNIDRHKAEEVFKLMAEFAGYGFAKSHSTAYALITFQTAYLKANYECEYLAAVMTTEAGNNDKLGRYITYTRQRGIELLPPDVNESARDFTVVSGGIRFGLAGVKNVGEGAIDSILKARAGEGGRFESLFGFADRINGRRVNRRVVESLIKCGAFDSLHDNRAAVWAALDSALEAGAAAQRDREIGQGSLFGGAAGGGAPGAELPEAPEWTNTLSPALTAPTTLTARTLEPRTTGSVATSSGFRPVSSLITHCAAISIYWAYVPGIPSPASVKLEAVAAGRM
jgi:DNA polymerase-3 subunit alpha